MSSNERCGHRHLPDKPEGRPYRSHSHPACLACRKRKSRCKTRDTAGKCVLCQIHGSDCVFPQQIHQNPSRRSSRCTPRSTAKYINLGRTLRDAEDQNSSHSASHHTGIITESAVEQSQSLQIGNKSQNGEPSGCAGIFTEVGNSSSHIISPTIADDNKILESYLTTTAGACGRRIVCAVPPANDTSARAVRPVLFDTVPKRPPGVVSHATRASEKCELIEKLVDPYAKDLVDLFFAKTNICFPIIDESSFKSTYLNHRRKISPALLATLYASALIYWQDSPTLQRMRCPDVNFVWAQANEALNSEVFLSPGMSTVIALILDVCGRPSTSMFCNGGLIGLGVALSNAQGLHRDPSNWNIQASEKQLRVRIWWLVVVHDCWCSLAYGTPMHIHRAQHDVPIPNAQDLCSPGAPPSQILASSVFISLVTLTEVLGHYLEYMYHVKGSPDPSKISCTNPELPLVEWEGALTGDVRRAALRGLGLDAPGAANLRLAYLAVRLLLRRIQIDQNGSSLSTEEGADCPFHCRAQRAAEDIVHFVQELDEWHFRGFWMPANAFTLTSATSFLMRSALRSRNSGTDNVPLKLARDMIDALQSHKQRFSWDLADNCLENCGGMLEKIEAGVDNLSGPALPNFEEYPDIDVSVLDDLLSGFGDPFSMEI
ncbi:hypothetical protein AJ79_08935 [Helicocarpus griseus UAMH5409]|uniref:Zn(2)-C6 fungal-type domain-containing protein n=1 Tax=Helicocarpus griseus UAMH5409 TaxID=1447875 RepID=A0A2B7WNP6_9EURO|nr:hypothetical protein AJ79_08935 [Helicocarpus griseus UAMH5409]